MPDFYNSLDAEEMQFFNLYKSNAPYLSSNEFASTLNKMLENGKIDAEWQRAIDILDQIIAKNKIEVKQTLFRVMALELFNLFRKDDIVTYPAYLSTGTDYESVQYHYTRVEKWQAPALLKINCPANTYIAPFENELTSEFEKEMLLGRNHTFNIVKERIESAPQRMSAIMGPDMAADFNELHIIELNLQLS